MHQLLVSDNDGIFVGNKKLVINVINIHVLQSYLLVVKCFIGLDIVQKNSTKMFIMVLFDLMNF